MCSHPRLYIAMENATSMFELVDMSSTTYVYGHTIIRSKTTSYSGTIARSMIPVLELCGIIVAYIIRSTVLELRGNTGLLLNSHLTANLCSSTLRLVVLWIKLLIPSFKNKWIIRHFLTLLAGVSIHSMCAIIVNVYLAVVMGRQYNQYRTQGSGYGVILVIWIENTVLLFSPLILMEVYMTPMAETSFHGLDTNRLVSMLVTIAMIVLVPVVTLVVFVVKLRSYFRTGDLMPSILRDVVLIVHLVCRYTYIHMTLEGLVRVLLYVKLMSSDRRVGIVLRVLHYCIGAFHICQPLVYMLFYERFRRNSMYHLRKLRQACVCSVQVTPSDGAD